MAGADFTISIKERNLPLGNVIGHDHAELSDEKEAVTNDDSAVFTATFANARPPRSAPRGWPTDRRTTWR